MPTSEYTSRMDRLQQAVAQHHLDAFIASNDDNISYLTGVDYASWERKVLLIVRPDSMPILIVPRMELERLAGAVTVDDIRDYWEMDARLGRDWKTCLRQALGRACSIALEPTIDADIYAEVAQRQATLLPLIEDLRVVKSQREIALIRNCAAYADEAMTLMLDKLTNGMSVGDVMQCGTRVNESIEKEQSNRSSSNAYTVMMLQAGANAANPHYTSSFDETLRDMPAIINSVMKVAGYATECERTVLIGAVNDEVRDLFSAMREAQSLALSMIEPGRPCADVDIAVQKFITESGLSEHMRHRVGHGLGRQSHERPYTSEGSEEIFCENMVISVEPGLYVTGLGGFRHSDTVIVSADGAESITRYPRDMDSLTFA